MTPTHYYAIVDTAIGPISISVNSQGDVTEIYTRDSRDRFQSNPGYLQDDALVQPVAQQIIEYARGERKIFDVKLNPSGTEFQKKVWELLIHIPFGETRTYGQLAAELGNPNASRAVGRANATNPISIIVPCHRVIGASGDLTGYAGGLDMKQRLLTLEGILKPSLFG